MLSNYKSQMELVCFVEVHSRQDLVEKIFLCERVHFNSLLYVSHYVTAFSKCELNNLSLVFLWFFRLPCLVILYTRGTETKH